MESILVSIAHHPSQSTAPYVFHFGPFRFESEVEVPELRTSTGPGERRVTMRLGGVPATIEGAVPYGEFCEVAPAEYLLHIPGAARYYVCNGNEVRIEIAPNAHPSDVSTFLLGSVFGVLCHQNGLLPLHASTLESRGIVAAFLGDSGAGKSTLAACLQRRGHRIVSDDICLLQFDPDPPRVLPVAGWLKLWNDSLKYLGKVPCEQDRVHSEQDKYRLFLPIPEPVRPCLDRLVFLSKDPDPQAQPALHPLDQIEAIAGLMEMTYVCYVPILAGQRARVFQQCARVFQHAKAWRLTVPWGLDRMDSVLDLLEKVIFTPSSAQRQPDGKW